MAEISDTIRAARAAWRRPGRPGPNPRDIVVPQSGQESVWDFPRPPRVEPWGERIRVEFGGHTVVDSTRALRLLETSHPPTYYIPRSDIDMHSLRRSAGSSLCEWKGAASYFDVVVGDREAPRAAWTYRDPFEDFAVLRDHIAFYCAAMDACWVGAHQATPQPGGFYGGWVSPHVTGPFKGGPGSTGW